MEQVPVTGLLHTFLFSQMKQSSRLLIKTAILMPEARDGEVTIVEVESIGFNKTKVDWMMIIRYTRLAFRDLCCLPKHYHIF